MGERGIGRPKGIAYGGDVLSLLRSIFYVKMCSPGEGLLFLLSHLAVINIYLIQKFKVPKLAPYVRAVQSVLLLHIPLLQLAPSRALCIGVCP